MICVLVVFLSPSVYGGTVVGSKHDFTGGSLAYQYNTQVVCVFCHTPHSANPNVSLLWNRNLPNAGAFNLYNSVTLDAAQDLSVTKFSLLCLSCHDGVTAINAVISPPADNPNLASDVNLINPAWNTIGDATGTGINTAESTGNLRNDHPVGFIYDANLVNTDRTSGGFASDQLVIPGGVQPGYVGNPADKIRLFGDSRVECTTCHDPHDPDNGQFLVKSNANSGLCFSCHIK